MELALIASRQILIMLILMGVGILSAKTNLIDDHTNSKLSSFLLFVIAPVLIFSSFLRPLEADLVMGLLIAGGLSVVSFAVKLIVTGLLYRKSDLEHAAIEKFACIFSNAGFIGIPLIQGIFGSEGVFYLTAYLTLANFLNWTYGIMIMSGEFSLSFFTKALRSPAILSIAAGFIVFFLQIELPDLITDPIDMLSGLNAPLAMMVAGYGLSKANFKQIVTNLHILKVAFVRLLLLPLLVIAIFSFFNVPTIVLGTIVVVTGCPVAVSIVLFSYRYEKNDTYATELMISTTILSMLTIPLLLFFI